MVYPTVPLVKSSSGTPHDRRDSKPGTDFAHRCNNVLYIISLSQRLSPALGPDDLVSSLQGSTFGLTSSQKARDGFGATIRAVDYALVVAVFCSKCTRKLHGPKGILSSAHEIHKTRNVTDSKTPYPRTPAEISDILSGESLK
jgi:hypothetical protein